MGQIAGKTPAKVRLNFLEKHILFWWADPSAGKCAAKHTTGAKPRYGEDLYCEDLQRCWAGFVWAQCAAINNSCSPNKAPAGWVSGVANQADVSLVPNINVVDALTTWYALLSKIIFGPTAREALINSLFSPVIGLRTGEQNIHHELSIFGAQQRHFQAI